MTTSTQRFNASVFDSYTNLRNFFLQSNAINEVLSEKDKPFTKALYPLPSQLSCKWRICQVTTAPFRYILVIFSKTIAIVSRYAGAHSLAKRAKTFAQCQRRGFNAYTETPLQVSRIKKTCNRPNAQGKIVCRTPSIPESRITDPRVKKRTFIGLEKGIKFNHPNGICRGICEWFLYLYLHTQGHFSDPRRHMATLGRHFAKGGGQEATLLHSLFMNKGKLINLKFGTQTTRAAASIPLLSYTCSTWKSSKTAIVSQLQNLPVGAYNIGLPVHNLALVKISPQLCYFFDPNLGIVEVHSEHVGDILYGLISNSVNKTGETDERVPPGFVLQIDFTPVKLRTTH